MRRAQLREHDKLSARLAGSHDARSHLDWGDLDLILLPTLLGGIRLISDGGDGSFTVSDIDGTVPFTISATTEQHFNANESVLVLAGSQVLIETAIDDMHCKVDAVLSWQLQKLCIGIATM
jgi:hypothetical protein